MKAQPIFLLLMLVVTIVFSQRDYTFGSTGRQKLLINPAFCASSEGIELQTLVSSYPYPVESPLLFSNYSGLSYGGKKLSIGLSNTYYSYEYYNRVTNQSDLSLAYRFKFNSITLIPSLQTSFYTSRTNYNGISYQKSNGSISSGLLLDIKKTLTFGASFYDMNQLDMGLGSHSTAKPMQFYHLSLLLFKEKTISLQPYAILKKQYYANYLETGAYTNYKFISIHAGIRRFFTGFGKEYFPNQKRATGILGLNFTYKKLKFGYTIYGDGDVGQELFLSLNFLNTSKSRQRSLMLN